MKESLLQQTILGLDHSSLDLKRRVILQTILCDRKIIDISKWWRLYLGRHTDLIKSRLEELGFAYDTNLIFDIKKCLEAAYYAREKSSIYSLWSERSCFDEYESRNGHDQLRCECCGYHFTYDDLGDKRSDFAESAGLVLSHYIDPRRLEDDLKPVSEYGKDRVFSKLEIDHKFPRAGLGSNNIDNLLILCAFCNAGKGHFLYPLESVSLFVANSLSYAYHLSGSIRLRLPAVVSAIRFSGGVCCACKNTKTTCELTVRFRQKEGSNRALLPWLLETICYNCLGS